MTPMLIFELRLRPSKAEVEVLEKVGLESRAATGVTGISGFMKAIMDSTEGLGL